VFEAGVDVDDEILAMGDYRVRAEQLAARLDSYRPGDRVTLLVARREKIMRVDLTLGEEPGRWQLELSTDATGEQERQREEWLGGAGI
jgi:predicted metalloprotease with PDZ domain